MTDRTPTSDPVAVEWEAMRRDRRYSASGDLDGVIAEYRPIIEEAIRQQARAAFAAQVAALRAIIDLPTVVPDHPHGGVHPPYLEWTRVAAIARAALAASPEPASPEAPGSGLREAAQALLDAESEPALSWVIESQSARAEGRPNREVERMERIATARAALRAVLAARPDGAEADA